MPDCSNGMVTLRASPDRMRRRRLGFAGGMGVRTKLFLYFSALRCFIGS